MARTMYSQGREDEVIALRKRLAEADAKIAELREALGCEMDDTRNACGVLNDELDRVNKRLAEAEALLRDARRSWLLEMTMADRIDAFLTPNSAPGSVVFSPASRCGQCYDTGLIPGSDEACLRCSTPDADK